MSNKKYPRYVLQRDKYNCGPIAIVNALKWACSKDFNGRNAIKEFSKKMGTFYRKGLNEGHGVYVQDFDKVLQNLRDLRIERYIKRPKIKDIEIALKNGFAVIFVMKYENGGHYYFIEGKRGKKYTVVNREPIKAVTHITKNELLKDIKSKSENFSSTSWPVCWIVDRVNCGRMS